MSCNRCARQAGPTLAGAGVPAGQVDAAFASPASVPSGPVVADVVGGPRATEKRLSCGHSMSTDQYVGGEEWCAECEEMVTVDAVAVEHRAGEARPRREKTRWEFFSSSGDKVYTVQSWPEGRTDSTELDDGTLLSCDCRGWIFSPRRGDGKRRCKHVEAVARELGRRLA